MGKSDKSLVSTVVIGCLIAMIGFQWCFFAFSDGDFLNPIYIIIDIVLMLIFLYGVNSAYKNVDTAKDNATRVFLIIVTLAIIGWGMGWAIAGNERVAPGSPQMEVNA